jgi:cytochrome c-type biogenesis protein CcsB
LFTTGIATYALAMVGYTAEYAFGRRGRIADATVVKAAAVVAAAADVNVASEAAVARSARATSRVLAGAGGPSVLDDVPAFDDAPGPSVPTVSTPPVRGGVIPSGRRPWGDRLGRLAVVVTVIGALLHLTSIAIRGAAVDSVPWSNMYEFASVVGFVAVLAFLGVLFKAPQVRYLGLFVMLPVVLTMFLAGTVLYSQATTLVPALQSYWLAIHVTAAASAEGILMTSSVLTMLFLARRRYESRAAAGLPARFPASLGPRLPSLDTLDKIAYRTAAFAFPIYTFGVIAGAIWAEAAWGRYWGWDPKETWAFIAWVVYAAYLHARATAGMRKFAPWINLLGFGAMTFNFFVVNIFISGLHSYAGLN